MHEEEFFQEKLVIITLGKRSDSAKAWKTRHVRGTFRVHCVCEGGSLEARKQSYYNSLDESIKGGWSRGNRGHQSWERQKRYGPVTYWI